MTNENAEHASVQNDSFNEELNYATNWCTDRLLKQLEDVDGHRRGKIGWYSPNKEFTATLAIDLSNTQPPYFFIKVGITPAGTDRFIFEFFRKGPWGELIAYLRTPESRDEIVGTILEMWKKEQDR